MVFDKNQTEFRNCIQERIWEIGVCQIPLEISLPYVPDELKPACTDYFKFNQNLLEDMYENPDKFGFEINPLKTNHSNRVQVEFYFWLLGYFGKHLIDNRYEIPVSEFNRMAGKFNPKSVDALKEHGFTFNEKGDTVVIYNYLYPNMFIGSEAVGRAGYDSYKVNRDYFQLYCDFRALGKYKRTYKDLHFVLSDNNRRVAENINEYAAGKKIKPQQCSYYFRVFYKHKGQIVYTSDLTRKNQFTVNISFAEPGSESVEIIEKESDKYDDAAAYKEFLLRNIKKCENCNPNCWHKSNPREVFGKKRIICGGNLTIRVCNPEEQSLKHIFRTLDLKTMAIK